VEVAAVSHLDLRPGGLEDVRPITKGDRRLGFVRASMDEVCLRVQRVEKRGGAGWVNVGLGGRRRESRLTRSSYEMKEEPRGGPVEDIEPVERTTR
jgi:hypothetical protein